MNTRNSNQLLHKTNFSIGKHNSNLYSLLSRPQTAEMHSEGVNIPRGSTDGLPQGQGRWERRRLQPGGAYEYRVCPGDAQGCPGSLALEQTILASVP